MTDLRHRDEPGVAAAGGPVRTRAPARRFGDADIQRILQTAVELQERSHPGAQDTSRGLTLDELRQVAEEAGIDARFVDLAASHVDAPVERRESLVAGGPYVWHFRAEVDGEVPNDDRDRILQAIRSVLGHKGEVADVYGRMEWSHNDGAGPTIVGVSSKDGRTAIDVSAVRSSEVGMIYGLAIPFGGAFGGAAIAGVIGVTGTAALPLVGLAGLLSYGVARLGWRARSAWWERRLRRVVERLSSAAQDVAVMPELGARDDAQEAG